ncbi:MAG: hypothetical protein ONB44_05175 [candidate division KSB1 bacterium]|nr:hypothetical protein [candidate division KSB1 bacterium]MDZ7310918.1 hypothetical protein [candidate division KSB1 bacterium]
MTKWQFVAIACLFFSACGTKRGAQHAPPSPLPIAWICNRIDQYVDQAVELEGIFLGWRGADCHFPANASNAITRSDWVFKNGEDCVYVTAGRPAGLDPTDMQQIGHRVQLRAAVRLTKEKKVYLEFISGKILK